MYDLGEAGRVSVVDPLAVQPVLVRAHQEPDPVQQYLSTPTWHV